MPPKIFSTRIILSAVALAALWCLILGGAGSLLDLAATMEMAK